MKRMLEKLRRNSENMAENMAEVTSLHPEMT